MDIVIRNSLDGADIIRAAIGHLRVEDHLLSFKDFDSKSLKVLESHVEITWLACLQVEDHSSDFPCKWPIITIKS